MSKRYEDYTDEELVRLYQEGDRDAIEYLLMKHRSIVTAKASNYFLKGGERDDLLQIGLIGLMKAVWNYREDKDASFVTFANTCVDRALISAVNKENSSKNLPLNESISLYVESGGTETEEREMPLSMVQNLVVQDPEEIVLEKERLKQLQKNLMTKLSGSEKQVFYLLVQELDYKEIARILNKSPKSVDNAITRIKGKARVCLSEIRK